METNPQNIENQGVKKFSISFIVLILVIAVAVLGYFFVYKNESVIKQTQMISGLDVAIKTASFLDKTLQADGRMIGGFKCDQTAAIKCTATPLNAEQPHVGQAIYSYFILAEESGDSSFREKSNHSINKVLDACDTDIRMCEWNFFPIAKYYEVTKEEKYLTRGMLRPALKFLSMPAEDVVLANVGHKFAALYKATGDDRYKNRLVEVADGELAKNLGEDEFLMKIQLAWSVYIPAYSVTNDPKYLKAAEDFFDSFDMPKNLWKFQRADGVVRAVDVLLDLAKISEKGHTYKAQAHSILQQSLDKIWDTPEKPIFNGDYGFVSSFALGPQTDKYTLLNGWFMKMFVLMADDEFEYPST